MNDHAGQPPTLASGDAAAYFRFAINWNAVDLLVARAPVSTAQKTEYRHALLGVLLKRFWERPERLASILGALRSDPLS